MTKTINRAKCPKGTFRDVFLFSFRLEFYSKYSNRTCIMGASFAGYLQCSTDVTQKNTTASQTTTITWKKTHRWVRASCEFNGLFPCELISDMLGAIINPHAPATIRSSTPSVSGSKFLIVVFYCSIDHNSVRPSSKYLKLSSFIECFIKQCTARESPTARWARHQHEVFKVNFAPCTERDLLLNRRSDAPQCQEVKTRLTVSLHRGDEVSVQEEVHVGEIWGGPPVHHHVVQNLRAHAQKKPRTKHTDDYM